MNWTNINQPKKKNNAKVEKFLVDVNMSDEISSVDNFLLKSSLLDCLVKHLRSRPIQTRAYQLLHDLVVSTKENYLFSDEDLTRTFTLVNSSLKVWEGNEYVSAACFEFLAELYTKCVTHDFPDFNEVLLQNGLLFLERLRKSKAVVKAVTSFFEKIYQQSGEAIMQFPVSPSILTLLVDLLSQYGTDSVIAYTCCQVISHLTSHDESFVSTVSYKIVVVTLSTMSGKHSNTNFFNFMGLLLHILKNVIREEKHISYLVSDEEEEFLFICGCIADLQEINDVDAITATLEIILRVVSSSFMRKLSDKPNVIKAIGDGLKTARRHCESCDGSSCLEMAEGEGSRGKCNVTQRHVALSNSIEQFFRTLSGYDEYIQQQRHQEEQCTVVGDKALGDHHDVSSSTAITVNLVAASDLINSDIVGVSDPYVILSLPNQSATSKTINNDLDPVFHQSFPFFWNGSDPLLVEVWDFDAFKSDDPIGHCSVHLAAMQLSVSAPVSVDMPLEGVEHGRIQLEIKLQDETDAVLEKKGGVRDTQESPAGVVLDLDTETKGTEVQKESITSQPNTSTHAHGDNEKDDDSTSLPDMSDMSVEDFSTEVDHTAAARQGSSRRVDRTPSPSKDEEGGDIPVKKNRPPLRSPSYSTKSENDDVMMVMIRALQDEVEDWKQKYTDMKWAHDSLVRATEEPLSPGELGDIKFESFDRMQNSTPPIENDVLFSNVETPAPIDISGDENIRDNLGRNDDYSSANGDNRVDGDGIETPTSSSREPVTPSFARKEKEGSDYVASVSGMKSAFSFCMSPSEGRHIDVNDLMRGDLSNKDIDNDVAMDLYKTMKWLFKHLRSIQSTNMEKMFRQMVLPRNLLRKFLLDDCLQLLHPRRLQGRDVDIILHNVPSKVKFPDFVFVLVACASKRFAARDNLSAVKSSVLSRLSALIKSYTQEFHIAIQDSSLLEPELGEESLEMRESTTVSSPPPHSPTEQLSDDLRAFGIECLRKQDHVWKPLYYVFAAPRRDKRINFESFLTLAKDFNISPALISNSECFEIFEAVLKSNGKSFVLSDQPAINYNEFISVLFEIAIVSNCFGEEDQQFKLASEENIWKKVLNFMWFLESSKERSHIREKTILPNFKINRNALIVEDRLLDKKVSTNLQLSILKFK